MVRLVILGVGLCADKGELILGDTISSVSSAKDNVDVVDVDVVDVDDVDSVRSEDEGSLLIRRTTMKLLLLPPDFLESS